VVRIVGVETFCTEDLGSAHLQRDVPVLVGHYLAGNLLLDALITRRIGLAELNDAFGALRAGKGARSVLVLE
jgi:S-(hydroxymethyl)glutathione dehydrogenase/alcohol dehydrogenase